MILFSWLLMAIFVCFRMYEYVVLDGDEIAVVTNNS